MADLLTFGIGEWFETDYLPESGHIHLFVPTMGRAPRMSAGCVRLIEPTVVARVIFDRSEADRELMEREAESFDRNIEFYLDGLMGKSDAR